MISAKQYYNSTRSVETTHWTLGMAMAFAEEYAHFLKEEDVITVTLHKNLNYNTEEIDIPEGVIKIKVEDYQDSSPYYRYCYYDKNRELKECKIKWV